MREREQPGASGESRAERERGRLITTSRLDTAGGRKVGKWERIVEIVGQQKIENRA